MGDVTATVERAGATVVVHAPEDAVTALADLGSPFVQVTVGGAPDGPVPSVHVVAAPPAGGGWDRVVSSSAYEPDRVLWTHGRRRAVALLDGPGGWRDQQLLRSVRHLLRWQAYAAGDLFLHGGLVRSGGRGILVAGGKRSGKTSTILSTLLRGRAEFVSNDDVTLADPDGAPVGHGWPRTVTIRTDVILALARRAPRVRRLLAAGNHPTNRYPGRHRAEESVTTDDGTVLPSSVWVRCAELEAAFDCRLSPAATVNAVVFPRFDDTAGAGRIRRLDGPQARTALLSTVEPEATKYDPFLAGWFPRSAVDRREALVDRLLTTVPCFALVQDMTRLEASTDLMLGAVA